MTESGLQVISETRRELYRRQSEETKRTILTWPSWMRHNLTHPKAIERMTESGSQAVSDNKCDVCGDTIVLGEQWARVELKYGMVAVVHSHRKRGCLRRMREGYVIEKYANPE